MGWVRTAKWKVIVLYCFPEIDRDGDKKGLNERLWREVGREVDRSPQRREVIILTDANGKVGNVRGGLVEEWVGSEEVEGNRRWERRRVVGAVGGRQADKENRNGATMRLELEKRQMAAANTFMDSGHTYVDASGNGSRIDYVCIRTSELQNVETRVLRGIGESIWEMSKEGNRQSFIDHIPVAVKWKMRRGIGAAVKIPAKKNHMTRKQ